MLEPLFESRFPLHPAFTRTLGMKEVSRLIGDLFGAGAPNTAEVQELAEAFALPLGLVSNHDGQYLPEPIEALTELPVVREAFDNADLSPDAVISLTDIYTRLQKAPYGLTREAQHLIMAAFVAQRHFEFVTNSGNRINRRSLDLQIIWDDIVGIARPSREVYTSERLLIWASLLTGIPGLESLDTPEGRLAVGDALAAWLADWEASRLLQPFDSLSDENLNARDWRSAANLKKTFEAVAESVA